LKRVMQTEVGYTVNEAFSDEEAFEMIDLAKSKRNHYKFIVIDLDDSTFFLNQFMENLQSRGLSTPVYFVSTDNTEKIRSSVAKYNSKIVFKPFDTAKIREMLSDIQ